METQVVMLRFLDGTPIRQLSKEEMFNATDMLRAINKYRLSDDLGTVQLVNYFNNKSTHEFIDELSKQKNIPTNKLIIANKKRGTWVHPYIMSDIALWGFPKLKVKVYDWIHDNLLQYRDMSGDSFKKMNMVLNKKFKIKGKFWIYSEVANRIGNEINMPKTKARINRWNSASEKQLKARDNLQNEIISASLYGNFECLEDCIDTAVKNWRGDWRNNDQAQN